MKFHWGKNSKRSITTKPWGPPLMPRPMINGLRIFAKAVGFEYSSLKDMAPLRKTIPK